MFGAVRTVDVARLEITNLHANYGFITNNELELSLKHPREMMRLKHKPIVL